MPVSAGNAAVQQKPYVFKYGQDFQLLNAPSPPLSSVLDTTVVKDAIQDGFKEALYKLSPLPSTSQPSRESSQSGDLFASPSIPSNSRVPRRVYEPFIEVRGQRIPAEFFHCEKVGCRCKVHNDCLGLPTGIFAAVARVVPWYCTLHVGVGRVPPPDINDLSAHSVPS
ncbi:unnamed protein product [Orchesella dallaii]|uniref:Uncharacterized protein n=1 Tax=Orchesella dallaii TaxID=48710 RepID=A0ABP1R224_9HEXA